jgi:DHA1 family bicyclomycin/chloramphenicol resistance-like MFS transporter
VGRLPVLNFGLALFTIGAIAAATADSIGVMLAGRFIQGFGAAPAIVLTRAIVRDVSSGKDAARMMSLMTMIFTAAPVIAPSIGAALVTHWGWRAPFLLIIGMALVIMLLVRLNITETHRPSGNEHPARQLKNSFVEFFSHRQSIFGLLLVVIPPAGYLSIIALAAALVVEIYGFSLTLFGLLFALFGISILIGASVNRLLVARFDSLQVIAIGILLYGISGVSLLLMAWFDSAPFALLWANIALFMFTIAIVMPNATVLALDPLPRIAGVASSIIGTLQNIFGASGALLGAAIYNGTIRNSVVIMGCAGVASVLVFLARPILCPTIVHHPDELARD